MDSWFYLFLAQILKMRQIVKLISNTVRWIGLKSAWLNFILVLLICFDVVQRYLFNTSSNAVLELEWHLFGLIFLLGSGLTLQMDKHVRVDVFYANLDDKKKAIVDVLGILVLVAPFCIIGIMTCYNYASNSFYLRENSPNPGGLPAWYLIKYCMVLCFVLISMQAMVMLYEKIQIIRK